MKIFVYIIFAIFYCSCSKLYAQSEDDNMVYLKNKPLDNCYIFKFKDEVGMYKDPADFMIIFSTDNNLFSLTNGYVKRIKIIDNVYYVNISQENSDTTYIYGNIDKLFIDTNSYVKKGDIIGKLLKDKYFNSRRYSVILSIMYKESNDIGFLNYIDIYEFLIKNYGIQSRRKHY